ncbi:MAG: hypothetical protein H7222_17695, partial [Methylotenera sp.]|nr:hypothetical protein [Oligoflexia bacterium]
MGHRSKLLLSLTLLTLISLCAHTPDTSDGLNSSTQSARHSRQTHRSHRALATATPTLESVIDYYSELLGNEEYSYAEFLWKANIIAARHRPPLAQLSDDEAVAIIAYTSQLYGEINRRMRGHLPMEDLQVVVDTLNSALGKLPKFIGAVKRSSNLPEDVLAEHQVG